LCSNAKRPPVLAGQTGSHGLVVLFEKREKG
jgi:hypothetical protein